MSGVLFRSVEVDGRTTDVRLRGDEVIEVGRGLALGRAEVEVAGGGAALIPGLHDHHLHLLAAAAALESVVVGPPQVRDLAQFEIVLRAAAEARRQFEWIRAVGYHESVAGEIDRAILDALVPNHPLRIQHRSGAAWILNSAALYALHIESATGLLYGADDRVRERLGSREMPSLGPVGSRLASFGVTGVTDATPSTDLSSIRALAEAATSGALPQNVRVMGAPALAGSAPIAGVEWDAVKFVIADHRLPTFDEVCTAITTAHDHRRPVAIHCVTLVALSLALAAWEATGVREGDRIEHGAVITPDAAAQVAALGLTVVTQPGFIAARGDQYAEEVDRDEVDHLYRCGSLISLGVAVAGSTDAPFGDLDPWSSVRAAIDRRTESGRVLGARERIVGARALELFLGAPDAPGAGARRVTPGATADLCLLDAPLHELLHAPAAERVVATWARGRLIYAR